MQEQQLKAPGNPFWKRITDTIGFLLEGKQADHKQNTIGSLDGVRGIACLIVIIFHSALITSTSVRLWSPSQTFPLFSALALAGDTGVNLFFILSGFLLFLPYASSMLYQKAWPAWRRFYLRRIFRILPAYYVSLVLMILLLSTPLISPQFPPNRWSSWVGFLTLFMDSFKATYKKINGPFWTLAVEWQFYLFLPLIALGIAFLVTKLSRQSPNAQVRLKIIIGCLLGLAVWGVFSRWLGVTLLAHPIPASSRLYWPSKVFMFLCFGAPVSGLHGKFMENFAFGMLVSTLYTYAQQKTVEDGTPKSTMAPSLSNRLHRFSPYIFGASILWLVLLFIWKYAESRGSTLSFIGPTVIAHIYYDTFAELGYGIGYSAFILAILFGGSRLKRVFEWKPLRWLGLLSYGLYMWHLHMFDLCTDFVLQHPAWPALLRYSAYWIWFVVAIIPCVFLLYITVERPGIQIGARLTRSNKKQAVPQTGGPLAHAPDVPRQAEQSASSKATI